MRGIIRTFVFVLISIFCTNYVLSSISYGGDTKTFLVMSLTLAFLFYLSKPLLITFGLPGRGIGFLFISTILASICLYVLTIFLPQLMMTEATLSGLIIFGVVLPSKSLNAFWSTVFSAFLIAGVFTFLDWLCCSKK
ncbi:MAG: hypothetical protein KatS3mg101_0738 [Patescibacteria group bacterium]|nr:MAG: hypothetical protein KatS3mg101_0738 [Patescibacteria group bacterium]